MRRHIGAHAGEQSNHSNLAHVGGFAAHIGAGDDLHARFGVQVCVVGHEGFVHDLCQARFNNRMTAACNLNTRLGDERGRAPVEGERALGQSAERVKCGQRSSGFGERFQVRLELIEHLLVEKFLAREGSLLGRQCLVFKGFQLGCDESLGIFQGLAAAVVIRHFAHLALRDFDEKAMHFVVLDAKIGDTCALALAGFEVEQEGVAVGLNAAQLIKLHIKASIDHIAITHQGRWLGQDRSEQKLGYRLQSLGCL